MKTLEFGGFGAEFGKREEENFQLLYWLGEKEAGNFGQRKREELGDN